MFAYNLSSSQHSCGGSLTNNNNTKCRKWLASDVMYTCVRLVGPWTYQVKMTVLKAVGFPTFNRLDNKSIKIMIYVFLDFYFIYFLNIPFQSKKSVRLLRFKGMKSAAEIIAKRMNKMATCTQYQS